MEQELADILIYLVRIADKLGIDLVEAGHRKVDVNKGKYPSDAVKGDSRKYTEYYTEY